MSDSTYKDCFAGKTVTIPLSEYNKLIEKAEGKLIYTKTNCGQNFDDRCSVRSFDCKKCKVNSGKNYVRIIVDGPCGSGKTTMVCLLNYLLSSSGHSCSVFIDGGPRIAPEGKLSSDALSRKQALLQLLDTIDFSELSPFLVDIVDDGLSKVQDPYRQVPVL